MARNTFKTISKTLLDYIMSKRTSVKCGLMEIIELKANWIAVSF